MHAGRKNPVLACPDRCREKDTPASSGKGTFCESRDIIPSLINGKVSALLTAAVTHASSLKTNHDLFVSDGKNTAGGTEKGKEMGILDKKFFSLIGIKKQPTAPWAKYYKKSDMQFEVPNKSIYQYLKDLSSSHKDATAIEYMGTTVSYRELFSNIDMAARAFRSQGIRKGDVVTILSANIPEALYAFYGLNKIGAVANMLHPLLSENEIKDALNKYSTVMLVAMDICYKNIKNIIADTSVYKTVIMSAANSMPMTLRTGYMLTQGRNVERPKKSEEFIYWRDFIKHGEKYSNDKYDTEIPKDTPALILQSGGSTGTPKGIVLSDGNVVAATIQAKLALPDLNATDSVLGIMPIFHGFGLSVSINDAFAVGAKVVLIPQFNAREFDKLIKKYNPTVLVGVPTLFEAMTSNPGLKNASLRNLKYLVAGGDSFNKTRVNAINKFLHERGAQVNFTQGFGMTEAVAAVSFDLKYASKPGTVGIPWPGTYIQICEPGTDKVLDFGTTGELCICGPTVMLGYYDNEKETNDALRIHSDGNVWLHSGDLASMDRDGYITFRGRIKRMIVSSGYNVYPSQIEEVLERHPGVLDASVIGVPHPYKIEVAKAYIVLKPGYREKEVKKELLELCGKNLAKYSIPREWEFRDSLPKTIVGKVDFRKLQQENMEERAKKNAE